MSDSSSAALSSLGLDRGAAGPTASGGLSERALVGRARQGDARAFELLVRKYRPRLISLASRYTHDACDAEDVVQEALVKAYRGLRDFRGECAFYTWLYRITINSARNVLQSRVRERACIRSAGIDFEQLSEGAIPSQDLETPEQLTFTEDIRATVNASLKALPEVHRTAIMLRELEGMSYEQIATAMGTPVGTVRSRVFRARELIDRELRRVFEGGLGRKSQPRNGN